MIVGGNHVDIRVAGMCAQAEVLLCLPIKFSFHTAGFYARAVNVFKCFGIKINQVAIVMVKIADARAKCILIKFKTGIACGYRFRLQIKIANQGMAERKKAGQFKTFAPISK